MMEVFAFTYGETGLAVGWDVDLQLERVLVDDQVMSVKPIGQMPGEHSFELVGAGEVTLGFSLQPHRQQVDYTLRSQTLELQSASVPMGVEVQALWARAEVNEAAPAVVRPREKNWLVLGSVLIKLFKSFKVLKVALMAASVAVYSVMFTLEFALALVAVLMFHEYGHMRAMQKFGIPTKGIYLIPFFGGVALGERARTQWEEVYISLMGPVFGLIMTAVFYGIFVATGNHFCGLVASTSALLNLINLFPVYPLDGGRVVKALVFSRRNYLALILLLILSSVCLFFAWKLGMVFLCFFIVVGVVDLISAWSVPLSADITPLSRYGIWFCLLWYLVLSAVFIGMIVAIAASQLPGTELAMKILQS